MNYTTQGEILQDKKNGKERPWVKKKINSTFLAESFLRLDMQNKAKRTFKCGEFLKFAECKIDDYKKLIEANFCRDRLCPMCNWRRSRKLQQQIFKVLHAAVDREPKMRFIFLTLTVENVKGQDLGETITKMLKGFKELFDLKNVDDYVLGYVRNLEVTYNKFRDDYHPHVHVLMGVKSSYFSSEGYIKQNRWTEMWAHLLKLDYKPIVDIRPVKKRSEGQAPVEAAMEIGKYSAKTTDYLHIGNEELTDKVIKVLAAALKGRHLIGFGKLFRNIHKELNLVDVEDKTADLVGGDETNCTCPLCGSGLFNMLYKWNMGYRVYVSEE
jgi:plasmid rolling circle replication initiator protein Rep